MKRILIGLAVIVVLLVGAVLLAPMLLPQATLKAQIEQRVAAATGQRLVLEGDLGIGLLPSISLVANGAKLYGAGGDTAKPLVELDRLAVEVSPLPLLSGKIDVTRFVLTKPQIHLAIDAAGKPNWAPPPTAEAAAAPAATGDATATTPASGGLPLRDIRVGQIRIEDGSLDYSDARNGTTERVDQIGLDLALESLTSPLAAKGGLRWREQPLTVDIAVAEPMALVEKRATAARFAVKGDLLSAGYEGNISPVAIDGAMSLDTPSLRKVIAWVAQPVPDTLAGMGRLALKSRIGATSERLLLGDIDLALDDLTAKGNLQVGLGANGPRVEGKLATGPIDLNTYLGQGPAAGGQAAPAATPQAAAPAGWSDTPLALPALPLRAVDVTLTLDSLKLRRITVGPSTVRLVGEGDKLRVEVPQLSLYGGTGTAQVSASDLQSKPEIALKLNVGGVDVKPLMVALAGEERLTGTLAVQADVRARGQSEKALVSTLGGKGSFNLVSGVIAGLDLPKLLQQASAAIGGGSPLLDTATSGSTVYSKIGTYFTADDGIVQLVGLELDSDLVVVTGAGAVDLPQRRVDNLKLSPKVNAIPGVPKEFQGLSVPVVINGPFDKLSFKPDLGGLITDAIKDPAKLQEQLKSLGGVGNKLLKGQQGDAVNGLLKGLLGGNK